MPNININRRVVFSGNSYLPQSIAIFNSFTTAPSAARKLIIDTAVRSLISSGIWNLLDVLWVMAAETSQAGLINWKSPGTYTMTLVNSPTFTANQGFAGNGTTSYINSGWDAATNGVNYTRDSASKGVYSRTNSQESSGFAMGALGATNGSHLIPRNASDQIIFRENQAASLVVAGATNSSGFITTKRTGAADVSCFRNGASIGSGVNVSTPTDSVDFYICAYNNNGVASGFSSRQYSVAFLGSGSIDHAVLYTIIQSYMTSIGSAV